MWNPFLCVLHTESCCSSLTKHRLPSHTILSKHNQVMAKNRRENNYIHCCDWALKRHKWSDIISLVTMVSLTICHMLFLYSIIFTFNRPTSYLPYFPFFLLPHHLTSTPSYFHTILLPHYLTSTPFYFHTILLPHYLTSRPSYFQTILLPHYLTSTPSYFHNYILSILTRQSLSHAKSLRVRF